LTWRSKFQKRRRKKGSLRGNKISLGALCLGAANIPMKMQKRENKTGIRKAGATRFMIFTPPNTIKHSKMVTRMP
jgi:hypothetical protein